MNATLKEGSTVRLTGPGEIRVLKVMPDGSIKVRINSFDEVRVARDEESRQNDIETTR